MRSEMAKWWRSAAGVLRTVVIGHIAPPPSAPHRYVHDLIEAVPRDYTGRRLATKERAHGRIPSVVYPPPPLEKNPNNSTDSEKLTITTDAKEIKSILESVGLQFFCSTRFQLQIRAGAGSKTLLESRTVLPTRVQMDQATGKIVHLRFVWAEDGTNLKVYVPVIFKGEDVCPGIKKGGFLKRLKPSFRCQCPAEHIPQKIEVDVSNLEIGDGVFIRDVELHPSIMELLDKGVENTVLCCIKKRKLADPKPEETNPADQEPGETDSADPDPIKA